MVIDVGGITTPRLSLFASLRGFFEGVLHQSPEFKQQHRRFWRGRRAARGGKKDYKPVDTDESEEEEEEEAEGSGNSEFEV